MEAPCDVNGRVIRENPPRWAEKKVGIDYDAFGRALKRTGSIRLNRFEDNEAKREILKAANYTHLKGRGGVRIPIEEASVARVGAVFINVYTQYEKRN